MKNTRERGDRGSWLLRARGCSRWWRSARTVLTVLGLLALLAPAAAQAAQEQGPFDEPYFWGAFDRTPDGDDWFYDRYSYDLYDNDWTDNTWFSSPPYYSGLFNDKQAGNDWFYDAYVPPTGSTLFPR